MNGEKPAILEITTPGGELRRLELLRAPAVIGRMSDCDIQLDSQRVSRRHAELLRDADGGWRIRDLGSRNRTRMNGQIIEEQVVGRGDVIEICQFKLRIAIPGEEAAEQDGQTTNWSADDTEASEFRTLRSSPAQRLHSAHLNQVNSLSQRLPEIHDARQRLIEVCALLTGPRMSCTSAAAVRIATGIDAQGKSGDAGPQLLCPFQLRAGESVPPRISRAVVEAAIAQGQPILAGGAVASGLTVNFADAERGVTAIIACPLKLEPTFAEVLYATVPHACGTLDWLALVALAAEQWKKAELQIEARRTMKDNALIQHDLNKARKIQMSLVPKSPTAPGLEIAIGFEPCLWIGGDYANVLGAAGGKVCLIVADVSGKGMPAAMVATGVHSVVDASMRQGESLEAMAERLNAFLIESMDRQSHLTALAVLFDPRSGRADYFNAGHPPMLIGQPDGQVRTMDFAKNPPLGVLPTSPTIDSTALQAGEVLLLYTDGLSEMYDAGGKMIGVEGVTALFSELYAADHSLALAELRDRMSRRLDEIRGDSPITDDRTFLLARRI
jgi:serine phosphatase RsbU (regulator of sigma subunit)